MNLPESYALKARRVFPVEGPPLRDGIVTIDGTTIRSVGNVAPPCEVFETLDLGNVAILPGLVNAHVHLEFSDLTQPLGQAGMGIADWIPKVLALRQKKDRPSLAERLAQGVRESLRHGTTTLGEIATDPWPIAPSVASEADIVAFHELLGRDPTRSDAAFSNAERHLDAAAMKDASWHGGLSPHAPYTITQKMLSEAIRMARFRHIPLAVHLAESREEIEYLATGKGSLAELMGRHGSGAAEFASVHEIIERLTDVDRSLLIHGNYLDEQSVAIASRHADRMAVVYCPRTHAFFGHDDYPLARLLNAGVNVALGTDGRSSNPDLNLLAEMRYVASRYPDVPGEMILTMGTLRGAVALGRDQSVGSLRPGKDANLLILPLPDDETADPHAGIFESDLPVLATIYRGRVVHCDPRSPAF